MATYGLPGFPVDENRYIVPIYQPDYVESQRLTLSTTSAALTINASAIYRVSGNTDLFYQVGGAGVTASILGPSSHLPYPAVELIRVVTGQTQLAGVAAYVSGFLYVTRQR